MRKKCLLKPVVSMEVLESRELLLSLSESIAFHRLPTLETIAVITKAKGANVFCWDDRRGFLCFARQKRVCIFRHEGGRGFVEVKEFGVPDMVKSMCWCGENICLGIRREYLILNATNGALSEVFTSGRLAPPLVVSLPSEELLLGKAMGNYVSRAREIHLKSLEQKESQRKGWAKQCLLRTWVWNGRMEILWLCEEELRFPT